MLEVALLRAEHPVESSTCANVSSRRAQASSSWIRVTSVGREKIEETSEDSTEIGRQRNEKRQVKQA